MKDEGQYRTDMPARTGKNRTGKDRKENRMETVQQRMKSLSRQQEAYRELMSRFVFAQDTQTQTDVLKQVIQWIEDHLIHIQIVIHNNQILQEEEEALLKEPHDPHHEDEDEEWGITPPPAAQPRLKPDDPRVATYRLLATLYERALVLARTAFTALQGRSSQKEAALMKMNELTDHQVAHIPYFGQLSLMDHIRLLEGTPTRQKGLVLALLPHYGQVSVNEQGWFLTIDERILPLTGEALHTLVVCGTFAEMVPYTQNCVLPSLSWEPAYDGMTVIVPPETTVAYQTGKPGGETILTTQPWRISMHRDLYVALVWSVSFARYGQQEARYYSEITAKCFEGDAAHVPANQIEVQYWQDHYWWASMSEAVRAKAFQLGYPLSWLTRDELRSFSAYEQAWHRQQARIQQQATYERTLEEQRRIQRLQFFRSPSSSGKQMQGGEGQHRLPIPPSSAHQFFH